MGEYIQFIKATITKHDKPLVVHYKTGDVELNYKVEVTYSGQSVSCNVKDLDAAIQFINDNKQVYSPSWEEVTCNGKYSCD